MLELNFPLDAILHFNASNYIFYYIVLLQLLLYLSYNIINLIIVLVSHKTPRFDAL